MLQVEVFDASRATEAAATFHRDGFVVVPNALTPDQLALAESGANRVIKAQMEETELEKANRGFARYSFGEQTQHPEWRMLIDLPTTLPILEAIWGNGDFACYRRRRGLLRTGSQDTAVALRYGGLLP